MEALDAAQKIDLLRAAVRIALSCRAGVGPSGDRALFVRVHLANVSSVVVRNVDAALTLLVPSQPDRRPLRFTGIEADNPLLPVTGDVGGSTGGVEFVPDTPHDLEPGECIQSEVLVPLSADARGVVALRILVRGTEGRMWPRWYEWGAFAFVDPSAIGDRDHVPLGNHASHPAEVH